MSVLRVVIGLVVGVGLVATVSGPAAAQTSGQSVTNLIQQFLQGAGTTQQTTGTTTSQPTEGPTGTTPLKGRQSTISNQFTAATGGGIATRRPGLWVEQGIAEHNGTLDIPGDYTPPPHSFFRQTFDMMAQDVLTLFSNILTGVDTLITSAGSSSGGGGSSTITFVPPPNASTTWQSAQQTIP